MSERPLLSVVVPVMNEADCLGRLYAELVSVCAPLPYRLELVFVDDGSTDRTLEVLAGLRRADGRVCYLSLSRNFGHQAALTAGLEHASGDVVVMMDGDLQHPPAVIPELLAKHAEGYDVVNTLRRETEGIGPVKRLLSAGFYRVFNWLSSLRIAPGGADFRLMSRRAVDALNSLPEAHRFLRGLVPWIGFRQAAVEFDAPRRFAGRSKYDFWRSMRLALEGITAHSLYPLRRAALFGCVVALASALFGAYAIARHVLVGDTVPGWTSLLVCTLFFGGCQLLVAGLLGEYVGRTLEQVKGRPRYVLRESAGFPPPPALSWGRGPRGPFPEARVG